MDIKKESKSMYKLKNMKKLTPITCCSQCTYRRRTNSLIRKECCTYGEKERDVTIYVWDNFPSWCPLIDAEA